MSEKEMNENREVEKWTEEATHNAERFFSLLFDIDKRSNPEAYRKSQNND